MPLPTNNIAGVAVFTNDASVVAALNNVYSQIITSDVLSGNGSIGQYSGLYTDELTYEASANNTAIQPLYLNTVVSDNTGGMWTGIYNRIYSVNRAIEGITTDSSLLHKNQWLGEAYFLRGFLYFYLTNLYGDVPLATTSLYTTNNTLSRNPAADVYKQIISDLKQAQSLLTDDYIDLNGNQTTDRARPNKATATAMLARVYLYTKDYKDAEAQADSVISNSGYQLESSLNNVFLSTSKEMIWGLDPSHLINVVPDAPAYIVIADTTPQASQVNGVLSSNLLSAFEPGDQRRVNWVDSSTTSTAVYYYAYKYKVRTNITAVSTEYLVPLRLAEQYLIRAEARAYNNNLEGAKEDLDMVRTRAGLPNTTASSQSALLTAILHERQVELFTECGHRFFDLRRTGNLDKVMNVVSPQKGSSWQSFEQWWPIPTKDIQEDPNLTQTPGYQE
ncbi:hypothetical protein A9P82_01075 [Arachidicoccus ginsenosidimutans]|nr:hypothetical protein A9P82_01075 [Arachidicoccus sp. BS20]